MDNIRLLSSLSIWILKFFERWQNLATFICFTFLHITLFCFNFRYLCLLQVKVQISTFNLCLWQILRVHILCFHYYLAFGKPVGKLVICPQNMLGAFSIFGYSEILQLSLLLNITAVLMVPSAEKHLSVLTNTLPSDSALKVFFKLCYIWV